MSWKDSLKDIGGGDITFLSSDGAFIEFVVVDEPIIFNCTYQKQEQQKVGWPVMTADGFTLLIVGKRVARKMIPFEKFSKTKAFSLIRHGAEGDVNATYKLTVLENAEPAKSLFAAAKTDYNKQQLVDAVAAAKECMDK